MPALSASDDVAAPKKIYRPLPKLASMKENADHPDLPVTPDKEGSDVLGGEGEEGEGEEAVQEEEQEEGEERKKSKRKPKVTMADFHPDVRPVLRRAKKDFCAMMAADNMYPTGVNLETMVQGAWDRSNEHYYPDEPAYELTEAAKSLVSNAVLLDMRLLIGRSNMSALVFVDGFVIRSEKRSALPMDSNAVTVRRRSNITANFMQF